MNKLKSKIRESLQSVAPISLLVIALSAVAVPMPAELVINFLIGTVMLIVGMGLFSLGADMAMMPIGEGVGRQITLLHKLIFSVAVCFLLGLITTVAEPDLQVLARQLSGIPPMVLILTVGLGVGLFLVVGMLRPLFKISLAHVLWVCYGAAFLLSAFTPLKFIPVAFDSGGVTTGPITVPFIISLGVGLASMRHDQSSQEDSFGLVSLCSAGPIIMVLFLGMFFHLEASTVQHVPSQSGAATSVEIAGQFMGAMPDYIIEIAGALIPVIAFFTIFQLCFSTYRRRAVVRISVGVVYTFLGLVLFLTGVNVGFMPAGHFIGKSIAMSPYKWLLIPLGLLIGYCVVDAEPAVHVLNKQVEEISGGTIPRRAMHISLACGVGCAVAFALLRALTGLSIFWMVIPGYTIALLLTFFVPSVFTGIAFDSGGVASGPMTTAFLLPLAMGACEGVGGSVLDDAFGIVASVAMTPLVSIQLLGLLYNWRLKNKTKRAVSEREDDKFAIYEYCPEDLIAHAE